MTRDAYLQDTRNSQNLEANAARVNLIGRHGRRSTQGSQDLGFQQIYHFVPGACHRIWNVAKMMEVVVYCGAGCRTAFRLG